MKPPTLRAIVAAVEAVYSLPPGTLHRRSNCPDICQPRQVAMWLIRRLTRASFPRIAAHFGMDHSTVMASVKRVEGKIIGDAEFRATVEALRAGLDLERAESRTKFDFSAASSSA